MVCALTTECYLLFKFSSVADLQETLPNLHAPAIASLAVGDDLLGAIMAAEDDLITAHRQHIEECMSAVREEMNLLANLDGSSGGGERRCLCDGGRGR